MGDEHSIINLGELAKPATVLVEKICDAIGGIAKPWQIKRVAEAEAEAERIRAAGEVKVTALHRRAARRFLMEEAKKQHNIESIIGKALPEVGPNAKSEQVEDDWIANFFDKCRVISNEQMQTLWAKILAGEANSPGKFSKRTVGLLASLDKADATMVSTLCGFACSISRQLVPVIYDYSHEIYSKHGISFSLLSHLESIGLIRLDLGQNFMYFINGLERTTVVDYFGEVIYVEFAESENTKPEKNEIGIGRVIFTQAGQQLAAICGAKPVDGFLEFLKESWSGYATPASKRFGPPQF